MKNKCILLISPEAWGVNFLSKHYYALELAKENTVYFLNPPQPAKGSRLDLSTENITENLVSVHYRNLIPKLNNVPGMLQGLAYKNLAKKLQKQLKINAFDLVWSFDPYRFYEQNVWHAKQTVYHCVDFHFNAKHESHIISSSDLTLVVSDTMIDYFKSAPKKVARIGHGFHVAETITNETVPGENTVKACYVGNVSGLLAGARLAQLAKNHPTVDFILIGPYQMGKDGKPPFETSQNVYLIGEVAADRIAGFLQYSSINLLLLKDRGKVPNANSHKLMAYFNSGKITLSDYLIDYAIADSDLMEQAKTVGEFDQKFALILANLDAFNHLDKQKIRKEFAANNTYTKKLKKITKLLNFEATQTDI